MNDKTLLTRLARLSLGALLVTLGWAAGCQGNAQSSSSTNWLRCQTDADCAAVAGATCRSDSVCVDANGHPIADDASGGRASAGGSAAQSGGRADGGGGGANGGNVVAGGTNGGSANGGNASAAAAGTGSAVTAGGMSGGASDDSAGAAGTSGGDSAAGAGGSVDCPSGPPQSQAACGSEGLLCRYAGSNTGLKATCVGGKWVIERDPPDPAYVCPQLLPAEGSECPAPPTPSTSPLVCLFDCAGNGCQSGAVTDCGATQVDCVQNAQTGARQWVRQPSNVQCPNASCDDTSGTSLTWSAPSLDKSCQVDGDCFVGRHYENCCGSIRYVGYNLSERQAFDAYEQLCQARIACACASTTQVEDGTLLNKGASRAACVDGVCRGVCTAAGCHFTSDCSASDECLQGTTCTWINPLSGSNLCRKTDGTCGGC